MTILLQADKQEAVPLSNKIGRGGTKLDNRWKIEASKRTLQLFSVQ